MTNSHVGRWSSIAVFAVGVAYFVALAVGLATRGLSAPIVDPLLAIMEMLTMIAALALLLMMAAIHGRASADRKTAGVIALSFMVLATGATCVVHFTELTAVRQLGTAMLVWPSTAYALEVLAWDLLLGLALLFAAFTFAPSGRELPVRRGLILCAALCLLGLAGPIVGNMRLQLIGVFGYAVVLPILCLLLSREFGADVSSQPTERR
jgi:uncharacterized membrane protein YhaH (DUF805 family)